MTPHRVIVTGPAMVVLSAALILSLGIVLWAVGVVG